MGDSLKMPIRISRTIGMGKCVNTYVDKTVIVRFVYVFMFMEMQARGTYKTAK